MNDNVFNAIDNYYKLKQKYEQQLENKKKPIRNNNDLTKKEKKIKFKQIKINCINCGKKGGTVFTQKNNVLTAVCGNTTKPCNLNININRGDYTNIYETEGLIKKDIESIKKKIMLLKLDLLFNYADESVIIKEFNIEKKNISNLTQSLLSIRKQYLSIIDNQEDKLFINDGNVKIHILKDQLKSLVEKYTDNNNIAYINEIIETYVRDVRPLSREIQRKSYSHMELYDNTKENKYELVQNKYNNADLHIAINNTNEARIISNKQ